ncbi:MAG: GNAT family N-acetyltransferase, partial [Bacteroidaceae bacterium]|nr:GNAT family N-acetyltransferase [Bacteroidaceae bacterium]
YLQSVTNDAFRDGQVRMAIASEQGEKLGFADLQNISALHGRAEVGIVILPECQRRGAALAALRQLEDYAHCQLHLHQLIAFVSADNQPSLALFEKAGYKKTATLPEWLSTPEGWADMCVFSLRL